MDNNTIAHTKPFEHYTTLVVKWGSCFYFWMFEEESS